MCILSQLEDCHSAAKRIPWHAKKRDPELTALGHDRTRVACQWTLRGWSLEWIARPTVSRSNYRTSKLGKSLCNSSEGCNTHHTSTSDKLVKSERILVSEAGVIEDLPKEESSLGISGLLGSPPKIVFVLPKDSRRDVT